MPKTSQALLVWPGKSWKMKSLLLIDDDLSLDLNNFCLNDIFDSQGPSSNSPLLQEAQQARVDHTLSS